jgi:hypothetical protein
MDNKTSIYDHFKTINWLKLCLITEKCFSKLAYEILNYHFYLEHNRGAIDF